ncbi:MAG: cytochrome c biogenesis protein ResB [Bdellovibrionales bacterium]
MISAIKKATIRLAEADMVFWLMPPLIILLIIGTITQRWIGLYEAHQTYFASFIIWAGPVPLPGGYIILGLLALNLTAKFLLKSEWSLKKSGIILSHLGTLVILIGGLITSIKAEERYIVLPEGAESAFAYHYTNRNFMIFKDEQEIARLPYKTINQWDFSALPFDIRILQTCDNCKILKREESESYNKNRNYAGMAKFMALKETAPLKEPEANLTGFELEIIGSDEGDGQYIAFDGMPKPIEFQSLGSTYTAIFGKDQAILPFSIYLKDFVKDDYQGTSMARNYHSDIIIKDGESEFETRIEMNKPLRYKGLTFFQSSFDNSEDIGEISILSVVQNDGWLFPYIGTIILGFGLLIHIIIVFGRRSKW